MSYITIIQAFQSWEEELKPLVIERYGADDEPALRESWNDYTDALCSDGDLCDLQYMSCPSYDEDMPDDDILHVLDYMGVTFGCARVTERPDGLMDDMDGASHWKCKIARGRASYEFYYSMGSAHKGLPDLKQVMYGLLLDAEGVDGVSFEEWCDEYGMNADSIRALKAYEACQQTALNLSAVFTVSELEQLRELYEDY